MYKLHKQSKSIKFIFGLMLYTDEEEEIEMLLENYLQRLGSFSPSPNKEKKGRRRFH